MNQSSRSALAFLLLVFLSWPAREAHAFGPNDKARVLYVGDSIAYETGGVVSYLLQASGRATFAGGTKGGTAICDWFPETRAPGGPGTFLTFPPVVPDLRALVMSVRPHAVALQFWGNSWDYTPCMRGPTGAILTPGSEEYYARYRRDANHAMEIIRDAARDAGIAMPKVLWVLQGPDRANPERTRRLNQAYLSLASAWPSVLRSIDAGREVSMAAFYYAPGDRYAFAQFLPCYQYERDNGSCIDAFGGVVKLHKDGDDIHFCLGTAVASRDWFGNCDTPSAGVGRYGLAVAGGVMAELGL